TSACRRTRAFGVRGTSSRDRQRTLFSASRRKGPNSNEPEPGIAWPFGKTLERLPRGDRASQRPAAHIHRRGPAEQEAARRGLNLVKIFVVDDDASLLGFMRRWLASLEGHEVCTFENGATAADALKTQPPCLVLSDLEMPGMSGEEVAQAAARLPRPPRIVLMSGDRERLER